LQLTNANEVFLHDLCDIYDAEHRFLEGQEELAQKATDQNLLGAIQKHIEQTRQQIRNLEQVFEELGQEPYRETCDASIGLVREAQKDIEEARNEAACDSLIDAAVAKVEHYEIASYRNLMTGAKLMGQTGIANLLNENLQQEEDTAQIAEQSASQLLQKAMQAREQEEGLMDKAKEKLMGE
jgi:ferritin-like metal-binding protein YciE